VAIVGGSKVSTKLTVLEALSKIVDQLVVGGGIANTFIAAQGHVGGQSLCEHDLIPTAQALMKDCPIPVPTDVVCGKEFSEFATAEIKSSSNVAADDMIFDRITPENVSEISSKEDLDFHATSIIKLLGVRTSLSTAQNIMSAEIKRLLTNYSHTETSKV